MSKRTRGYWRPIKLAKSWGIYDEDGTCVARVGDAFGVAAERREADARLVAASPRMVEALRAVEAAQRSGDYGAAFSLVKAALAEAEEPDPLDDAIEDNGGRFTI